LHAVNDSEKASCRPGATPIWQLQYVDAVTNQILLTSNRRCAFVLSGSPSKISNGLLFRAAKRICGPIQASVVGCQDSKVPMMLSNSRTLSETWGKIDAL